MNENAGQEEMTLSAETGLTEQKYHCQFVELLMNVAIFVVPFVGALLLFSVVGV